MKFCIFDPNPQREKLGGFLVANFVSYFPKENGLKFVTPKTSKNFTTFSAARKEIYHLELALGATSRKSVCKRWFPHGGSSLVRKAKSRLDIPTLYKMMVCWIRGCICSRRSLVAGNFCTTKSHLPCFICRLFVEGGEESLLNLYWVKVILAPFQGLGWAVFPDEHHPGWNDYKIIPWNY